MIYVLYDGPSCIDGFGAAFAFWWKYGDKATYIPISTSDRMAFEFSKPLQPEDKVFILDTSFPREKLLRWNSIGNGVTLIDHHASAKRELGDLDFCLFNLHYSGCVLAWNFLHAGPAPKLLLYIQDRDLWKFELDGTDEITTALFLAPKDFKVWNDLDVAILRVKGKALLEHRNHYLKEQVEKATLITNSLGDTVPVSNTTVYHSELGNELCKKFINSPYSMTFSVSMSRGMPRYKFSLRTIRPDVDVGKIAKSFDPNGGGHKVAAGFDVENLNLFSFGSDLSF